MFKMKMKILLSLIALSISLDATASYFESCLLKGKVKQISNSDQPDTMQATISVVHAKKHSDLSHIDCSEYLNKDYEFLYSNKDNLIEVGNFVSVTWDYGVGANGEGHGNWQVVGVQ